jgi:hypothetical protein
MGTRFPLADPPPFPALFQVLVSLVSPHQDMRCSPRCSPDSSSARSERTGCGMLTGTAWPGVAPFPRSPILRGNPLGRPAGRPDPGHSGRRPVAPARTRRSVLTIDETLTRRARIERVYVVRDRRKFSTWDVGASDRGSGSRAGGPLTRRCPTSRERIVGGRCHLPAGHILGAPHR